MNNTSEIRLSNIKKNIKGAVILKVVTVLSVFATRTVIIRTLGTAYLGLNSLFVSLIQILNIAELGFGSAVVYFLYKPIAENDTVTVNALLKLCQTAYRLAGLAIFILGIVMIPFLPKLIKNGVPGELNLTILYLIYLIETCLSYFLFSYRAVLLEASQQKAVISYINAVAKIVLSIVQILILLLCGNYYIFCFAQIIVQVFINISIYVATKKLFPQYRCEGKVPKEDAKRIYKTVGALFINKVGLALRNSFDSIILSAFVGLDILGIYQNYLLILTTLKDTTSILLESSTAGIGNSIATESIEKNYKDFCSFQLVFMWLCGTITVCMACVYQPFMRFWIGAENLFPDRLMLIFPVYFFTERMGAVCYLYRSAAGLWWEERFRPVVDGIVNIVLNIILVKKIGIAGVMLSTIICQIFIDALWGSYTLFNFYFKDYSRGKYLIRLGIFGIVTSAAEALCYFICRQISLSFSILLVIAACGFVCVLISQIIFCNIYRFLPEYQQAKKLFGSFLRFPKSSKLQANTDL